MEVIATTEKYNFVIGQKYGKTVYNIIPVSDAVPSEVVGYYDSNYICQIKGVSNLFLANVRKNDVFTLKRSFVEIKEDENSGLYLKGDISTFNYVRYTAHKDYNINIVLLASEGDKHFFEIK